MGNAIKTWKALLIPAACQFGVMPVVAFWFAIALDVTPEQGLSLVVVGCCPGSAASNILAHFCNSDVALSILATAFSTVIAAITLPLLIPYYSSAFVARGGGIGVEPILQTVAVVVLPVVVAMAVRHYSESWATRLEKMAGALAGVSVVVTIFIGVATQWHLFYSSWKLYVPVLLMQPIDGSLGFSVAKYIGVLRKSAQTLAFHSGLQSGVVGLNILKQAFGVQSAVFLEASAFVYMYLVFIYIHGVWMVCYSRATAGSTDSDLEAAESELVGK